MKRISEIKKIGMAHYRLGAAEAKPATSKKVKPGKKARRKRATGKAFEKQVVKASPDNAPASAV